MLDLEIAPFDTKYVVDSGVESGLKWVTIKYEDREWINGYVLVPKTHPYYDLGYSRLQDSEDIQVHGGLTYSSAGWLGFDTAHGGDLWPGQKNQYIDRWSKVWTPELVAEETRNLARQLAKITTKKLIPEEYPQAIHDLIYSNGFRHVHDETCALRTNEVSEEWYCDCELAEVLQLVGKK